MFGMVIAVSGAASVAAGLWELPCSSPAQLVAQDAPAVSSGVFKQLARPAVSRWVLTPAKPHSGPSLSLAPRKPRMSFSRADDQPTGLKGAVMRRFGLCALEGDYFGCSFRFARLKNIAFQTKFDLKAPAWGVAYVTRY